MPHAMDESVVVAALSSICLLYYLIHLYYLSIERSAYESARQVVSNLEEELRLSQDDCALAVVESELLRQILGGQSLDTMLHSIVQQFIPCPRQGWVAYIDLRPEPHVVLSRGEFCAPTQPIEIDDPQIAPALAGKFVTFHQPRVAKSRFLANFNPQDCNRFEFIYVLGIGVEDETFGLLVTTHLFPPQAPIEQQIEIARRMSSGLARHIIALNTQALQERELKLNSNRLTVRTLFDREFENPTRLTHQFLRIMQLLLEADCGILYFAPSNENWDSTKTLITGNVPVPHDTVMWHVCEEQLVQVASKLRDRVRFDEYGLELLDLNRAFKAALVLPIIVNFKLIGTMCFTRGENKPFTTDHQELLEWSVELLVEKMSVAVEQAAIKRLAQLDAVTQIANRHSFDRELERELKLASAQNVEFSVILFDLDRFKQVNDNFGHQAGDEALRVMGNLLQESLANLRSNDRSFCGRFGGEEFAVILPGVGLDGATRIGDYIRTNLEQTRIIWQDQEFSMTVSAGISTFPANGSTTEELVRTADAALYQAKNEGRNRIANASQLSARLSLELVATVPQSPCESVNPPGNRATQLNTLTQLQHA